MKLNDVLRRLERVRREGTRWRALCPAHDDRNPSLSVWGDGAGNAVVKCFAGCTRDEVMRPSRNPLSTCDRGRVTPPRRAVQCRNSHQRV